MAYCVHCGVKLAPSERICPLCGTEAVDPKEPFCAEAPKPYPATLDLFTYEKNRGLLVLIATLILALPAVICLACDLAYTPGSGWSSLVIGAMAFLWVLCVPHLFLRRHAVTRHFLLDSAALIGYLFLIERFTGGRWWGPLALPIVLLTAVLGITEYQLMKRKIRDPLQRTAAALLGVPFLVIGIEITVDLYSEGTVRLLWSWIVSIPCLVIAAVLLLLFRQARLRSQLHRRLFW